MHTKLTVILTSILLATLDSQISTALAQGTAFSYQGRLGDGANPANGIYDLRFAIYDSSGGPTAVAGPLTNAATAVSNGLFTARLDFGANFPGADRWLEIAVRTNGGGAFSTLSPRQQLTPTPYALYSPNAGSANAVAAANITGTLAAAQLPPGVLTNGASGVSISGTFSGNGAGVTNVSLATLNPLGPITWPGSFVVSSSPAVGNAPSAVVAADVNGDGKVDLISANWGANKLTVLTNNGSGGFGLASSPAVGRRPQSVVAADVNGDGKVDLISANYYDSTLTVLTNNGSGGFGLASSPAVGSLPWSVVAADVNGDGKVDLISANYGDGTLTVLTNNGSGGFGLASTLDLGGSYPRSVVAADVNGDGKVDLISANYYDDNNFNNTLTVLTNNGSGGFGLASTLTVGSVPVSVVAADVNGDGKVDLISANSYASTLTVLTNNGSGGFGLASSPAVGQNPQSVVAADVNGDGKVDLISANYYFDNTLTVLTNNGSGGFGLASSPAVGYEPTSVVAADVNGDGKMDLISANYGANTLTVLFQTVTYTGNGSGLNSLNASSLATGTVADARLSANVALRAGGNNFTGKQTVMSGYVGIGTTSPASGLHVSSASGNAEISVQSGDSGGRRWTVQSTGVSGNTNLDASLQLIDRTLGVSRFSIKTNGNVGIGTTTPNRSLEVNGDAQVDGTVFVGNGHVTCQTAAPLVLDSTGDIYFRHITTPGNIAGYSDIFHVGSSGEISCVAVNITSDRNAKEEFKPVNPREVLDKVARLPISEWQYKTQTSARHIGPMAQDFHDLFATGSDEKHIATVDADGVALAAIQGLNDKLEDQVRQKDAALDRLKAENQALAARLAAVERALGLVSESAPSGK